MLFESVNMGAGNNQEVPKTEDTIEERTEEGEKETVEETGKIGVKQMEKGEISRKEKIKRWEEKEREIEEWADAMGKGIDEGIKRPVVAFSMMEFPTSASCEGHLDSGIPAPWVEISALNEPEERFIGESDVFERVAKEYGVSVEEVKRAANFKAEELYRKGEISEEEFSKNVKNATEIWSKATEESSNLPETEEYKKWQEENKKLRKKAESLLEDFYKDREVPPNIRLIIEEFGDGVFRIHNGGEDYTLIKDLTKKQREGIDKRILEYRREMEEFANFLYQKYILEENN